MLLFILLAFKQLMVTHSSSFVVYRYGVHMNRLNEESFNHHMYNWQYWDKRNRLCHNMIMEHFEVHKEQLEDLIVDM